MKTRIKAEQIKCKRVNICCRMKINRMGGRGGKNMATLQFQVQFKQLEVDYSKNLAFKLTEFYPLNRLFFIGFKLFEK